MSISYWKMNPEIVFLGGRDEALALSTYFKGVDIASLTVLDISDETIAEAETAMKEERDPAQRKINKKLIKTVKEMLKEHKKKYADHDSGKDWFELHISW